jgi:hypothetical protein
MVDYDSTAHELTARLVVAAHGRSSVARGWGGFTTRRAKQKLLAAGLLLNNVATRDDTASFMINPIVGRVAFVFPQGRRRARAYLVYGDDLNRLQGERDNARFVDESINTGMPAGLPGFLTGPPY